MCCVGSSLFARCVLVNGSSFQRRLKAPRHYESCALCRCSSGGGAPGGEHGHAAAGPALPLPEPARRGRDCAGACAQTPCYPGTSACTEKACPRTCAHRTLLHLGTEGAAASMLVIAVHSQLLAAKRADEKSVQVSAERLGCLWQRGAEMWCRNGTQGYAGQTKTSTPRLFLDQHARCWQRMPHASVGSLHAWLLAGAWPLLHGTRERRALVACQRSYRAFFLVVQSDTTGVSLEIYMPTLWHAKLAIRFACRWRRLYVRGASKLVGSNVSLSLDSPRADQERRAQVVLAEDVPGARASWCM